MYFTCVGCIHVHGHHCELVGCLGALSCSQNCLEQYTSVWQHTVPGMYGLIMEIYKIYSVLYTILVVCCYCLLHKNMLRCDSSCFFFQPLHTGSGLHTEGSTAEQGCEYPAHILYTWSVSLRKNKCLVVAQVLLRKES